MKKSLILILIILVSSLFFLKFSNDENNNQLAKVTRYQIVKAKKIISDNGTSSLSEDLSNIDNSENLEDLYKNSQSKSLDELTKEELLAHMIKPFSAGNLGEIDFAKTREIADKIIDMDETIYAAHKLKFIADWIEIITKKETSLNKFSESLRGVQKFEYIEVDDQIGDAVSLVYLQSNKTKELKKYSLDLIQNNPNSGKGHYYKSMYYQSIKDNKLTIESLNKALELEPNNKKYLFALDSIKTGKKNIYHFSLTFDYDDF